MLLILVNFIIIECLIFVLMVIGAFILSHLGLLLVGRIDAFLSSENRPRIASSTISGESIRLVKSDK